MNDTPNQKKNAETSDLPDYLKDSKLSFQGIRFDVYTTQLPGLNHRKVQRDVVIHPGSVVILPIFDPEQIILIKNYRFSVEKTLWELPAGTREPNESPNKTAARELIEETGYEASDIQPLTMFYTSPGITNEKMYAFAARQLRHVGQRLDESEQINVEIVSLKKALEMIRQNEICDSKTIAVLLYYQTFQEKLYTSFYTAGR